MPFFTKSEACYSPAGICQVRTNPRVRTLCETRGDAGQASDSIRFNAPYRRSTRHRLPATRTDTFSRIQSADGAHAATDGHAWNKTKRDAKRINRVLKSSPVWYCHGMELAPFLQRELVLVVNESLTRDELLRRFSDAADEMLDRLQAEELYRRLVERENQSPTSTREAVAFPHAVAPEIDRTLIGVARSKDGVDFGVDGHPPATLVFCMFGCSKDPWEHVRLLARLARIVHTPEARHRLREAPDADALYNQLLEEDRSHG